MIKSCRCQVSIHQKHADKSEEIQGYCKNAASRTGTVSVRSGASKDSYRFLRNFTSAQQRPQQPSDAVEPGDKLKVRPRILVNLFAVVPQGRLHLIIAGHDCCLPETIKKSLVCFLCPGILSKTVSQDNSIRALGNLHWGWAWVSTSGRKHSKTHNTLFSTLS